jgi:hypothetical protein
MMTLQPVRITKGITLSATVALVVAACSSDLVESRAQVSFQVQTVAAESPILVMTQNGVPSEVMDAFFEGQVMADDAGCLRLEHAEGPTAVWPLGYTGEVTTDGVTIMNGDGEEVGPVGGLFGLGGGELPELLASLGFTQEDRDMAEALCPGRYWIVAP